MAEQIIHYHQCPACGSEEIRFLRQVTDYSISGETFPLYFCGACTLQFTQDVPVPECIGRYYEAPHYVSHSDTDKGIINKIYQQVKKYTIRQKVKMMEEISGKKGRLLDIGCGTGSFLEAMKADGWDVYGLEPDAEARALAEKKTQQKLGTPDEIYSLAGQTFDLLTLWHVLEHVHDLQGYVKRFGSILKPGGYLVIAVPNYTSADARRYGKYWAAYDVPRHLYHFSPKAMTALIEGAGFERREIKPMWFDSFYVSMLSEKYRKGNLARAILSGCYSNAKAFFDRGKCSSLIYIFRKNG